MGNLQSVERSEPYQIGNENVDIRHRERTDEGPQLDVSSLAHDSYFTSLMTPTAKEKRVFWGSEVEDIDIEPILNSPWTTPMNLNLNVQAEPLLKKKSPEAQWSTPTSLNNKKVEKPLKSKIPSVDIADKGKEEKTDRNRMAGHLIKDATGIWSATLGFSSDNFRKESPLFPAGMIAVDKHLSELPIIFSDENQITYQEELEDVGRRWVTPTGKQTLKTVDTSATIQGRSLADSNSPALEALPNITPSPSNVFNPLDGSQTTEKTDKSHQLSTQRTLKNTIGHYAAEPLINSLGLQEEEAEKRIQAAADTRKTKTRLTEDGSMSMPQPLVCTVQTKVDEETQIKSNMPLSYADALKSPKITQQKEALGKNEKLVGRQTTTHKATTRAASLRNTRQNYAQANSKSPGTESSKKITKYWNPTEPSIPPLKVTKGQLKFQWNSPRDNPKEYFQFKGSCNVTKPQAIKPNTTLNSGSPCTVSNNTSTRNCPEYTNPDKKDILYQSYQIERRSKPKLVCKKSPTCMPKEPLTNKPVVSFQSQDVSPQTAQSALPVRPSEEYSTSDVALVKTDQIKSSAPEELPKIKSATPQLMPLSDCPKTSPEKHSDTSDLGNSCPPVPQETTKGPKSKDQIPDQSLVVREYESVSHPTTGPQVLDNSVGMEKNDLDEASQHQPSGRWKAFSVDNHCTMKCRCRHRPGKLPPNVVRWFSVSQNRLAEPMWVTTLKVASTLVAGTKLLLDHHSSQGSKMSGKAPDKHPE